MKDALGSGKVIWVAVVLAFSYVVWFNFQKFVLAERYDFFVEAPCNPEEESCYLRDCDDYCPPNGLSSYKVWKIVARDFKRCDDDSCEAECERGEIVCEAIPCDPEVGDCS
jgi:hypothetical protein